MFQLLLVLSILHFIGGIVQNIEMLHMTKYECIFMMEVAIGTIGALVVVAAGLLQILLIL